MGWAQEFYVTYRRGWERCTLIWMLLDSRKASLDWIQIEFCRWLLVDEISKTLLWREGIGSLKWAQTSLQESLMFGSTIEIFLSGGDWWSKIKVLLREMKLSLSSWRLELGYYRKKAAPTQFWRDILWCQMDKYWKARN